MPNKVYCWLNANGFQKLVIMPSFAPVIKVPFPDEINTLPYSKENIKAALESYEIWSFRLIRIASEHMAYYELDSKTRPKLGVS